MQTSRTFDKTQLARLFANKQYGEALRLIESFALADDNDLSVEDLADIQFVRGQCLHRLGRYEESIECVERSILIADSLNDNLLYARQKYTLGQVYRAKGQIDLALGEFSEAYAFFKRVHDRCRSLIALTEIGYVHCLKGELTRSIEVTERVIEDARASQFLEVAVAASFNLCRVLLLTGDFRRVRDLLSEVAEHCNDALNQVWLESLRGMLYVRLHEHGRAETHLNRSLSKAREMGYRREEIVCLEYLGLNAFYRGNYREAIDIYRGILSQSQLTASAVAQTLWQLAEAYASNGDLALAAGTVEKAERALTEAREYAEFGGLYRAKAILEGKRGDTDSAREHFGKSIEILSRHGARYELAATYLVAGCCEGVATDIRLEHLRRSKTMFTDMGVVKCVAHASSALARIEVPGTTVGRASANNGTGEFITQNTEMRRILEHAAKFAATDMTILITGETGTGKDLLAKRIHSLSRRAKGPFCNHNMARLPRELADSELFGYEKNSHSRAERDRAGLIEMANGGTLCLNEVAELPLELQSKLLLSLEEKTIFRVGARHPVPVDVRFIAVTNSDLQEQVKVGKFREDLFFRLQPGHLHLPPLRERKDDLALLLQFFLKRLDFGDYDLAQSAQIVSKVGLDRFDWPGNVRQLENVISRAVVLAPMPNVASLVCSLVEITEGEPDRIGPSERDRLVAALKRNKGNKSKAADELDIPESTFRRHLRKFRID